MAPMEERFSLCFPLVFFFLFDISTWLRIEDNNKLIADRVPNGLARKQQVFITIKNTPGGRSGVFPVDLLFMD